jgi:hypothetical protein
MIVPQTEPLVQTLERLKVTADPKKVVKKTRK